MTRDDVLGLAIGDGGAATLRFVREEILLRFDNESLSPLEDASTVDVPGGRTLITTDGYLVDPPIFPGGDIGKLAICGTVNDLVAKGAVPRYVTLGLVLSEQLPLELVRRVLDSAAHTARQVGVQVVAGDTKVIPAAAGLGICICITGIGIPLHSGRSYLLADARPGDVVVVTGAIGAHALSVLSVREGLGFEQRVQSDCAPLHDLLLPILRDTEGLRAMRDPTRGGLKGVLFDIAEAARAEVEVDEACVPVQEEVRFGCEMLGLDPLDLVNEGKMVLIVSPEACDSILRRLRAHPLGRESALIGRLTKAADTPRVLARRNGRQLLLVRPEGQAVPRLC